MITKTFVVESGQFVPYDNLALETYLLEQVPADTLILYLWQNRHTVVIGKNQNPWQECKVTELERDGGYLARRLSGGGAVFHDLGNLNFTFLVNTKDYDVDKQLEVILQAMRSMGLDAQKSGRNDITIDGRKFSGNAFYDSHGKAYHHGTLLVDVDMEALSTYLHVDQEKLQSKGVTSVKSRVVNLKSLLPEVSIEALKRALIVALSEVYGVMAQPMATAAFDGERIAELTRQYASWQWRYGAKMPFTHRLKKRFPWGNIDLQLVVNQGYIREAVAYSDAMNTHLFTQIGQALKDVAYHNDAIAVTLLSLKDEDNGAMLDELSQWIRENV